MTIRVLTAAAVLMTALLGVGGTLAAPSAGGSGGAAAALGNYFTAAALSAGSGARNEEIRQRRVAAALSPLVIQSIVRQPRQIPAIMAGLRSAAPHVAPGIAQQAMIAFPGFAGQIAHAAGLAGGTAMGRPGAGGMVQPVIWPSATAVLENRTLRVDAIAKRGNAQAARAAAWAISAIAGNPGAIDEVMSRAIAAAPGGEIAVVNAVQSAYPGFAPHIANATARAPRGQLPLARVPAMRAPPAAILPKRTVRAAIVQPPVVRAVPAIRQPTIVQPIVARATAPRPFAAPGGLRPMDSADETDLELGDPIEPVNRIIFAFNDTVDLVVLRPLAIAYNWILPDPVILAVRRFFLNLDAPVIAINDLLQGDLMDAGITLGRFGINSTVGLLGLFDPAKTLDMERHHADFGQTLHSYDVGPGPYLVLPLLGPASSRGAAGKIVDIVFQPMSYLLSGTESLAVAAARGVVRRERLLEPLDELRENSIDYYAGLKAAFWQARQVALRKGTQVGPGYGGDSAADKLFDAAN
mgnify:FL=1